MSPSFNGTGIFSLKSKPQYVENPEKDPSRFSDIKRPQPQVCTTSNKYEIASLYNMQQLTIFPLQFTRRPSKRYSRRKSDNDLMDKNGDSVDSYGGVRSTVRDTQSATANNSRLINEMLMANGSLKRQNHLHQK